MLVQTRHVVWKRQTFKQAYIFPDCTRTFLFWVLESCSEPRCSEFKMRSPSEPCVWCRHWGTGITRFSEIPNLYWKLSQYSGIPAARTDCCLANRGGGWMFGHNPSTLLPEPRVWSVYWKYTVHTRISRKIRAMPFSSPWKTIPKEQKGQKVDADMLWLSENLPEGRMRSRRKLRGEATADQIFVQDTHRLAPDHGGVWPRWHWTQTSLLSRKAILSKYLHLKLEVK